MYSGRSRSRLATPRRLRVALNFGYLSSIVMAMTNGAAWVKDER